MLIYYVFLSLILGLPVLGLWPLVNTAHPGLGASNSIFGISMPSRLMVTDPVQWRAEFAEELTEHYGRWLVSAALVGLALLAVPHGGRTAWLDGYLATLALCVGCTWSKTSLGTRWIEYLGKAAYLCHQPTGTAAQEAIGLFLVGAPFDDRSPVQLERGIRRALPLAQALQVLLTLRFKTI